ncbi:hypothetical protein THRCLA_01021 [Thraustotheca clavata]|uniref:Uncharacterized protein n=1 Tax=Thraustotheca clavata TaxID=74557 RepID=A0A1W0AAA9_9STRA|nr:hypothetical protein THRCLA_01021 [Thraustotheca clavata]
MATQSKADKFVRLLSTKLQELPNVPSTASELQEKLENAVAALPNSSLKGLLQRDLAHYAELLAQLVKTKPTANVDDRFLSEQEYDTLLQATHATRLVQMPNTPADVFLKYNVPSSVSMTTPKAVVNGIEQLCAALTHELVTNGIVSALPSLQEPGHAVALYVNEMLPLLHAWMDGATNKKNGLEYANHLQKMLLDLLQLIQFHRPLGHVQTKKIVSFYLPPATTETSAEASESAALAQLYACTAALILFYPASSVVPGNPTQTSNSDDSDSDEDDVPFVMNSDGFVSQVLAVSRKENPTWLVDVVLMASSLPRPSETSTDGPFSRLVIQALRSITFDTGMGRHAFLRNIACIRFAKVYLKSVRLGNSRELSAITTQLSGMAIPFKFMEWLRLTTLSSLPESLQKILRKVLDAEKPVASTFLSVSWKDEDIVALSEMVQSQSLQQDKTAILDDTSAPAEENTSVDAEVPLFFIDNTGGN